MPVRKEYTMMTLHEDQLDPDPFRQFQIWYQEAIGNKVLEPDAMVLATSGENGRVSARVVLLKGFDSNGFTFFTNYRSRKGKDLAFNRQAAVAFHWKELERQVRIEGIVKKTSRAESVAYFNSRPVESQFSAAVSPQSSAIPSRNFLETLYLNYLEESGMQIHRCPVHWGGYRIKPFMFEFWQGREHRLHDRLVYLLKQKKWHIHRLAP